MVDSLGKQHDINQSQASVEVRNCGYIKLINVPSMLDINGTLPDPTSGALNLSMIDNGALGYISRFVRNNPLAADLSHAHPGDPATAAMAGNYFYDEVDPDCVNDRRLLDH